MNIQVYVLTKVIMLFLVFGLLSTIWFAIRKIYYNRGLDQDTAQRVAGTVVIALLGWLAILALLSLDGLFRDFSTSPIYLFYALVPPMILAWLLLFWPPYQRLLKHMPKAWLFYGQAYRLLTDLFLVLGFFGGFVPQQLTLFWLNQDYTIGATAIIAGWVFFGKGRNRRIEAIIWNVFGLLLLFNQVILGYLSLPFAFPVTENEVTSIFLTDFPFVWMWGFTIPFGFALHTSSLYQILFAERQAARRIFSLGKKEG